MNSNMDNCYYRSDRCSEGDGAALRFSTTSNFEHLYMLPPQQGELGRDRQAMSEVLCLISAESLEGSALKTDEHHALTRSLHFNVIEESQVGTRVTRITGE